MRFYALLLARTKGCRPACSWSTYAPGLSHLPVAIRAFEACIDDLWTHIASDIANDSFAARRIRCVIGVACARNPVFGNHSPDADGHAQWIWQTRLG